MKPLGYKCRHQHPGCACHSPALSKGYRLTGKRRDRQKARRLIAEEITRGLHVS